MKLRSTALSLLGAASLLAAANASAEDAAPAGPLDIKNFSFTPYFTTQYMFRGISNSAGPAVQGSVDWTYNGFYLGAWGSNTEFSDEHIEMDYYGGYRFSLAGIGFDVSGLYYTYPGEDENSSDGLDPSGGQDADYFEAQLIASYTFNAPWSPSVAVKYNFSPDFFGEDGQAHAVQGDLGVLVPLGFLGDVGFSASVGYQTVEGDKSSGKDLCLAYAGGTANDAVCGAGFGNVLDGFDYAWYRVGVYKYIADFKVDVSFHDTDHSGSLEAFYPDNGLGETSSNFGSLIDPHVVLTISRTFSLP